MCFVSSKLYSCPERAGCLGALEHNLFIAETLCWSEIFSQGLNWRASCFQASDEGARLKQLH